jgi:hypothetical protein
MKTFALSLALGFVFAVAPGMTSTAYGSTLHGCLVSTTSLTTNCPDNGVSTPTGTTSPAFTFQDSGSGTQTGDLWIIALIPNNEAIASALTLDETIGSTTKAFLTSKVDTAWTSGQLDTFLGISANPTNTTDAWLHCITTATQCGSSGGPFTADPGATGFLVYKADLGSTTIGGNGGPTGQPVLSYTTNLPLDSLVLGFQFDGGGWDATANSGALYANAATPEPTSLLWLVGAVLVGAAVISRRKKLAVAEFEK